MLRILRCEKSKVSPKILSYALYADDFKKEIKSALGEEYSEIISKAEISGDYVNFVTPLSGELDKVTEANKIKYQDALNVLEHRRDKVIEYLKSSTPLSNRALETHRKEFSDIIASDNTVFMVNGQAVIAPVSFNPHYKDVAVPPTGATTVPVKKRGCLLPFLLLLLLLLLLLFLLWWFLLRPWTFEGNFTDRFNSLFPQKEVPTQVVEPKKEDEAKLATTEEKTEPVEEEAKDPVVEEKEKTAEPEAAGAALETGLFSTALSLPVGAGSKAAGLLRFSKNFHAICGKSATIKASSTALSANFTPFDLACSETSASIFAISGAM